MLQDPFINKKSGLSPTFKMEVRSLECWAGDLTTYKIVTSKAPYGIVSQMISFI